MERAAWFGSVPAARTRRGGGSNSTGRGQLLRRALPLLRGAARPGPRRWSAWLAAPHNGNRFSLWLHIFRIRPGSVPLHALLAGLWFCCFGSGHHTPHVLGHMRQRDRILDQRREGLGAGRVCTPSPTHTRAVWPAATRAAPPRTHPQPGLCCACSSQARWLGLALCAGGGGAAVCYLGQTCPAAGGCRRQTQALLLGWLAGHPGRAMRACPPPWSPPGGVCSRWCQTR